MNKTKFGATPESWLSFLKGKPKEKSIDTLTAFVRDAEHELLSVLTALQAQIDLLKLEQENNNRPVDRFPGLNRSVARLIADTQVLATISLLATTPRSKSRVSLDSLMKEIISETKADFSRAKVTVSSVIENGTALIGEVEPLKQMCKGMLLVVLQKCSSLDQVNIIGMTLNKKVSIDYETGKHCEKEDFKPWRVGELRNVPTNGDGIKLAAIDAMARMHQGQLSVCSSTDEKDSYKLVFNV
ncbi:MAG: hypothetical protein K2X81_29635 [Candidatus Obscuribacterales bacterium]|nr:hypothetical protein [Candidatus Obscuribacterales bacterium]